MHENAIIMHADEPVELTPPAVDMYSTKPDSYRCMDETTWLLLQWAFAANWDSTFDLYRYMPALESELAGFGFKAEGKIQQKSLETAGQSAFPGRDHLRPYLQGAVAYAPRRHVFFGTEGTERFSELKGTEIFFAAVRENYSVPGMNSFRERKMFSCNK